VNWVLVLDEPSSDPTARVGGLPLALRLCLDAQAGGASAIVVAADAAARSALDDPRLRIPISTEAAPSARRVRVPASFVVHRALFRLIADEDDRAPNPLLERDLSRSAPSSDTPWAFAPMDVRDTHSRREAESALFRSLRKPQDGWTSRYLNRYISLAISRILVRTPLAPNQISIGILGVGLAGAWLATRGTYTALLGAAALFQAQSVLDGCDGEVSRITHRGSRTGEWLDTIGDDLTNYGFFAGAGIGLYRQTGSLPYLLAAGVVVSCGFIASGLEYRYLIKIGSGDLLKYPLSQAQGSGPFSFIAPLFKRDTFVFLTLIAALLGALGPMLLIFALGAIGILIGVVRTELRLAREVRT